MPEGASSKESIFPESQWSVKARYGYCKFAYNVVPRPNWITSEFGGHVSYNYFIIIKFLIWFDIV